MCRTNFPKGRLCSASKMLARRELESYVGRYKEGDNYKKYSTPSGEYIFMVANKQINISQGIEEDQWSLQKCMETKPKWI